MSRYSPRIERSAQERSEQPRTDRPVTILVIESDPAVRTLLQTAIAWQGHRGLMAENGDEGFEICATNPPVEVIVCDTDEPATGGLAFIEKVDRLAPDARIIAFTGGDEEGLRRANAFGVVRATVSKPCQISDFWTVLEYVLCDDCTSGYEPS